MGAISGRHEPISEEMIDATLTDSFPVSDPHSVTYNAVFTSSIDRGILIVGTTMIGGGDLNGRYRNLLK
jgi:hypothetical protein